MLMHKYVLHLRPCDFIQPLSQSNTRLSRRINHCKAIAVPTAKYFRYSSCAVMLMINAYNFLTNEFINMQFPQFKVHFRTNLSSIVSSVMQKLHTQRYTVVDVFDDM